MVCVEGSPYRCERGILVMIKIVNLVGVFALLGQGVWAQCSDEVVDLRWDGGNARFNVELANNEEERSRGLMFVESMGRYDGMLFVYDAPSSVAFWMKNTLIPLDILFLDEHGVVQHVHENAVPGSLETIFGGDKIFVVLEVNGGLVGELGLAQGAEMRHPAFAETMPAWACE